jgi:hypothetical protein
LVFHTPAKLATGPPVVELLVLLAVVVAPPVVPLPVELAPVLPLALVPVAVALLEVDAEVVEPWLPVAPELVVELAEVEAVVVAEWVPVVLLAPEVVPVELVEEPEVPALEVAAAVLLVPAECELPQAESEATARQQVQRMKGMRGP